MSKNMYVKWFERLVAIITTVFLFLSLLSTLYVFTYAFDDNLKPILFILIIIIFSIVIFLLRNKIKAILAKLLLSLEKLDYKTMIIIIGLTMIILKIVYTIFFNFDATLDGDISIYNDIANDIINTGKIDNGEISHLLGIGLHLAFIKMLNIPLHIGIFVVFFIATIINFISFNKLIGKEKAFILVMFYILMPSTIMLTFCPTHELFVYLYYSLFGFLFQTMVNEDNKSKTIVLSILMLIDCVLCITVNPAGYILLIIVLLTIILSNIEIFKRILLVCVIVFTLIGNNAVSKSFNFDETQTSLNTYSILIHGSSISSRGEHVNGYPKDRALEYERENGLIDNPENRLIAMKAVLKNQYLELLAKPYELFKLLVHKFYICWSGDHYSLELAYSYGTMGSVLYYLMLGISALIYLIVITIGLLFKDNEQNNLAISTYKLMILGVVAMLFISLVLNKYSVYVTIFIYLVSFYKININHEK